MVRKRCKYGVHLEQAGSILNARVYRSFSLYKVDINSHAEAAAPSDVSFTHDGTTITVTWTPPSSIPSNGYIIMVYYTDFHNVARDVGSVPVSSGSTSQVVIPVTERVYNYTKSVWWLSLIYQVLRLQQYQVYNHVDMCYHYS